MEINYLAVIVSTFVFFGIGAVIYTVFSNQWLNSIEKKREDLNGMKNMPTDWFPFLLSFVCLTILNVVLAYLIKQLDVTMAIDGALLGGLVWLGFVATTILVNIGYEDRKFSLFVINGGYFLLGLVTSGVILAIWQ